MNEKQKAINLSLFHTLRAIRFLLYFDIKHGLGNIEAHKLYREFNLKKTLPSDRYIPILCLEAIIGTHTSIFVWASEKTEDEWSNVDVDFKIVPEYAMTAKNITGKDQNNSIVQIVKIMRNAMSHFAEPLKSEDDAPLILWKHTDFFASFYSKTAGTVQFKTEDGFFAFIPDFMRAVDILLRKDMEGVKLHSSEQ